MIVECNFSSDVSTSNNHRYLATHTYIHTCTLKLTKQIHASRHFISTPFDFINLNCFTLIIRIAHRSAICVINETRQSAYNFRKLPIKIWCKPVRNAMTLLNDCSHNSDINNVAVFFIVIAENAFAVDCGDNLSRFLFTLGLTDARIYFLWILFCVFSHSQTFII